MDGFGVAAADADGAASDGAAADGGADAAASDGAADVPARPHAARKVAKPARAVPWTNRRRVSWPWRMRGVSSNDGSFTLGFASAGCGGLGSGLGFGSVRRGRSHLIDDDERMVGRPGQVDLLTLRPELGLRRTLHVLLVDRDRGASPRFDLVLRADPEVRRVADDARELIVTSGCLYVGLAQADLLWPHTDVDCRALADRRTRRADPGVVREPDG